MTFVGFLESFGTAMAGAVLLLGILGLMGATLLVWALVALARKKPSGRIGAALLVVGAGSLGYAFYAATIERLLPSERVHHIVWPALAGFAIALLGGVHLRNALRRKELAFLEDDVPRAP